MLYGINIRDSTLKVEVPKISLRFHIEKIYVLLFLRLQLNYNWQLHFNGLGTESNQKKQEEKKDDIQKEKEVNANLKSIIGYIMIFEIGV